MKLKRKVRQRALIHGGGGGNGSSSSSSTYDLRVPFEKYDINRTGVIQSTLFRHGTRELGLDMSEEEVRYLLREFSGAGGGVRYHDFCRFVEFDEEEMDQIARNISERLCDIQSEGAHDWRDSFRLFDKKENGFIQKREFREGARRLGLPIEEGQLHALMSRFEHFHDT